MDNLRNTLLALHIKTRNGILLLRSITRRRGTLTFTYTDRYLGVVQVDDRTIADLLSAGYIQVFALDASTEYLAVTEAGRAALK